MDQSVVDWRRHLHRNPEVSFEEEATAEFVESSLRSDGITEIDRPTPTSVVATIRGGGQGRLVALRADIDALPVVEEAGHEYVSQHTGVMHACGHDGHTAILLGVARLLQMHRESLGGYVRVIFQHAEERPPGGARELVASGVLDGVEAIAGLHLWAELETGRVAAFAGPFMAAFDTFDIRLVGRGGHAAQPHLTNDPIPAAAEIVSGLQTLVSRELDPLGSAVVSVTSIEGGSAYNVIPDQVRMRGTARALDPVVRTRLAKRIPSLVRSLARAHEVRCEVTYDRGYAPVINDPGVVEVIRDAVASTLSDAALADIPPTMASDDFSAYLERVPGAYLFVGARNERLGIVHPHHSSQFDLDEASLGHGTRVLFCAAGRLASPLST